MFFVSQVAMQLLSKMFGQFAFVLENVQGFTKLPGGLVCTVVHYPGYATQRARPGRSTSVARPKLSYPGQNQNAARDN